MRADKASHAALNTLRAEPSNATCFDCTAVRPGWAVLPHGIFVVSAYERHESPLVMADYVEALQVGIITHTSLEWQRASIVEPSYRG